MIAIVGAGAAGLSAAEALRELGYGGPLRLFGAEAATPYERPALSKGFLLDPELTEPPPLRPAATLAQLNIGLDPGAEVIAIDPGRCCLATAEEEIAYERLLLATGAEPRRLDLPGEDLQGVHYLRDLADARALRGALRPGGRVAILGGGVIGLEIAAAATQLGAQVAVIEIAAQLMGRIGPSAFAQLLEELHRARGVTIRTGVRPIALEGSGQVQGVVLEDGGTVAAETVLVGVGAVPHTALASRAGLAVKDGILVDQLFRSSEERIFAAGDAASVFHPDQGRHLRVEQWRPAEEQGRHAAACMLEVGEPYRGVPWMWSDQYDLHLQAAGFGFASTEVVSRGALGERTGVAYFGVREGRLVAACGISVGTGVARAIRAAQLLIGHGAPIDAEQLADPGLDLRRVALARAR